MAEYDVELFLDRHQISWEHNVERRLCQPEKFSGNPIIVPEHPWEELYVAIYGSVLPKENGKGFRMWYMSGAKGMQKEQMMCYAESGDGHEWHRVMFENQPYEGCKKTNIVLGPDPNIHGPCVLKNYHSDDPNERYLVFYDSYPHYRPDQRHILQDSRWCYTATSPDGINWNPRHGRPAVPGKSDTGQSVVWDPKHRRYIAYMRGTRGLHKPFESSYGETTRVRYVRAAVSSDFMNWSEPIELLRADEEDGDPRHQIHQFSVTRRGNQYIGFLSIFHIDEYVEMPYEDQGILLLEKATCDTQLTVSRDGLQWERIADRQPFLPLGSPGQWDSKFLITSNNMVFDGDRMLLYYAGTDHKQGEKGGPRRIGVATLPRDRFQALRPREMHQAAVIETKPLYLYEGDLRINADASHGRILVELCDFNGITIKGFSKSDCAPVAADGLDQVVRWNDRRLSDAKNEKEIFGKAIRIRFYIHHASLYAAYIPLRTTAI